MESYLEKYSALKKEVYNALNARAADGSINLKKSGIYVSLFNPETFDTCTYKVVSVSIGKVKLDWDSYDLPFCNLPLRDLCDILDYARRKQA